MGRVVLGIGTSHTPMLNATAEEWTRFAPRDPTLPLLDEEGRPTTYAALASQAGDRYAGECTRERYAAKLAQAQRALDRMVEEIAAAELDALVIVGDDQKELFLDDALPALMVYIAPTIRHALRPAKPEWVDWFAAIQARYYRAEGPIDYPVDAELARHLVRHFIAHDFDVATCKRTPRGEGEGHAFAFVHGRLMGFGGQLPVVPVFLNTYYPPNQPTPARCFAFGAAIRAAVESYEADARVGVLASGGLSHFAIDEALDRSLLKALEERNRDALCTIPSAKLDSGNSEIRNWIAAAGALAHLPLAWSEYIPAYRSHAGTGTGLCFAVWRE